MAYVGTDWNHKSWPDWLHHRSIYDGWGT